MACVLIIDDDKMLCDILSRRVREIGHDVSCEMTLEGGIKRAKSEEFDVIFLDVQMPDGNGLDSLPLFQAMAASPEVIIITGEGRPDGAELAIKNGAWDYIEKASSIRTMILPLMRALEYRKAKKAKKAQACLKRDGIIGDSIRMKNALDLLVQAANSAANVLISGETGTGKELFSWAIHQNSPRASNNFIVVDCSALPDTLVESMLFGHEKGAFTSADRAREGLIQQADGGTLFLDEVGELPLKVQKVFLRAVQERRFRPIGGCREINSDFRIIAATNQDLNEMVRRGRFRKDLLFRLLSLTIDLPPLRERPEDIKELAVYHLARLSDRYGTARKGFSPEFFETLTLYDWPGNVRELFNSLEKALVSSHDEPILFPLHLPVNIRIHAARASVSGKTPVDSGGYESPSNIGELPELRDFREGLEEKYLQNLIGQTKGNMKKACVVSGLSRSRLYALLKKHEIRPFHSLVTPTQAP